LQQRGMAEDLSWDKSALEYEKLYQEIKPVSASTPA
jgi:glycogen synthase